MRDPRERGAVAADKPRQPDDGLAVVAGLERLDFALDDRGHHGAPAQGEGAEDDDCD